MASVAEKKVILSLSDGASVNLNKPIDIPDSVTNITQITEPGWYHGKFTFKTGTTGGLGAWGGLGSPVGGVGGTTTDKSTILNTPAMKIIDSLTVDSEYNFDVFVTKTGDYIFNFAGYLFYGVIKTSDSTTSINWEIASPLVVDDLTSTSSNKALSANQGKVLKDLIDSNARPIYSTTDLVPGESKLADGQLYYYYITGLNGVSRKIINTYIGNSTGVAELIDGQPRVIRKTIEPLTWFSGNEIGAAVLNDKVLIGGGRSYDWDTEESTSNKLVVAYDSNFTKTSAPDLNLPSDSYDSIAASSNSNYAMFFSPGYTNGQLTTAINTYDKSLTLGTAAALKTNSSSMIVTHIGDYVLAGGGSYMDDNYNFYSITYIAAYDSKLTQTAPTSLKDSVDSRIAVSTDYYALILGGWKSGTVQSQLVVNAYDKNLTRTNPSNIPLDHYYTQNSQSSMPCTTINNNVILPYNGTNGDQHFTDKTVVYNKDLTVSTTDALVQFHGEEYCGAETSSHGLICGGYNNVSSLNYVTAFDKDLVQTISASTLSEKKREATGLKFKNYGMVIAGYFRKTIDVFASFD